MWTQTVSSLPTRCAERVSSNNTRTPCIRDCALLLAAWLVCAMKRMGTSPFLRISRVSPPIAATLRFMAQLNRRRTRISLTSSANGTKPVLAGTSEVGFSSLNPMMMAGVIRSTTVRSRLPAKNSFLINPTRYLGQTWRASRI